jgi:large subunit ribosomal protein L17
MAMIELVDYNEIYNAGKAKKKTTRRSRRGGSKPAAAVPVENKGTNEEEE